MKINHLIFLSVLLLVLLLTTCHTSKTPGDCIAVENPDCMCTMQYEPVCGCNKVTYSNACVAACNNITDFVPGECP